MPDPSEPFRFLDLPSEIRNLVYNFSLCPNEHVSFSTNLEPDRGRTACRVKANIPINTRLLRTCRQIHKEAAPILLGENIFQFNSARAFDMFMRSVYRHQVHLIRKIELSQYRTQVQTKETLSAFKRLVSLDTLVIGRAVRLGFKKPERMALALKPLVRYLHRARREREGKGVVEVLRFEGEGEGEGDREAAEGYGREVKERLRGYLE